MPRIWKTARIFISSTFRDMHAERDHLVKKVLPRLRARLAEHRVYLEDVDLRWGVTEEQAKSGQAVELCLQQVDECRPIFLCLLGSRYGWVPQDAELGEGLRQRFPWTMDHPNRSVTELEILYGALDAATKPARAFFCLRAESVNNSIPEPIRSSEYVETDGTASQRLTALKDCIRSSDLPCLDGYTARWDDDTYDRVGNTWGRLVDFDEFGDRVEEELWQAIKAEHKLPDDPPADDLDPLELEADYHERFLESRLRVHVGREADTRFLMEYVTGNDTVPCLLGGEMGSGKSTALAKLVATCRRQRPTDFVLAHFIGASPEAGRPRAMLRRCSLELKHQFELPNEIPDELDALAPAFRGILFSVPEDRRAVLVLDAVDQLEEEGSARQLSWLPEELPANVKVILSCRFEPSAEGPPKPCVEELSHRMVLPCEIGPLSDDERRQIARAVPSLAAKTLSNEQLDLLLSNSATRNPLYLRVALEELRGFGSFGRLAERITRFPEGPEALVELFDQILGRLEDDFEVDLVRSALPLMVLARSGLAEQELETLCRDLAGAGELHGLLRHLRPYLRPRGDRLDFAHQAPVEAIERRYLRSERARRGLHRRLAEFFAALPRNDRQVHELPWQLAQAADWRRLYELLANPDFLQVAWQEDRYEVQARWAQLERDGGATFRIVEAYRPVLQAPEKCLQSARTVAVILEYFGHPSEALAIHEFLVRHYQDVADLDELAKSLGNQAHILWRRGEVEHAMQLYQQQERIFRELGNKDGYARSLSNQACIHQSRGDLQRAFQLGRQGEQLFRELENKQALQTCLGNQAMFHRTRSELDRAMELLQQQEQLCRELGNKDGLLMCIGNQAGVHYFWGELDRAMELFQQQEQLCRELGNMGVLQMCLGNQGLVLKDRSELDRAMELLQQQERICRELSNKDSLQMSLCNQAVIHQVRGELDRAMELLQQQEQLCRELGNKDGLQVSLGTQALIHQAHGELDRAMELLKEQEQLCHELGNKEGSARSLTLQGDIHRCRGELDLAMELSRQAEQLFREQNNKLGLPACLGIQAAIRRARGELDQAMALFREQEQIYREVGSKVGLAVSLGNQAAIHQEQGNLDVAMGMLKQQEQTCREVGNKDGLQSSLGNQALILKIRGELDSSMELLKQQEQLCRELGNKDGLQSSLGNQALILRIRGELDSSMELLKQQEQLCRELGQKHSLQVSLGNQALILRARGELDRAMELLKEKQRFCEELGNKHGLQICYANQAGVHYVRGELERAMLLFRQQEQICRELGNKNGLQTCYGNQAMIHEARGELDRAMELFKHEERLCRELDNKDGLASSLGSQAMIHRSRGELDLAMKLLEQQERLSRQSGNKRSLGISLGNQALVLKDRGELDRALDLATQTERLCRELGDKDPFQWSLGNLAVILTDRDELKRAKELLEQQEQICREMGNQRSLGTSLGNQALVLTENGELERAVELHQREEQICRKLGVKEELATSLKNQADLLGCRMQQPHRALPLAEEALKVADEHGYGPLAQQIRDIRAKIQAML